MVKIEKGDETSLRLDSKNKAQKDRECKVEQAKSDSIRNQIKIKKEKYRKLVDSVGYLPTSEYDHIKHIKEHELDIYSEMKKLKPKFFIDYVSPNYLEQPSHKNFISDRNLLRKLKTDTCSTNYIRINDTLLNGDKIKIEIRAGEFFENNHKVKLRRNEDAIIGYDLIDGKFPFGGNYGEIERDLQMVRCQIGNKNFDLDMNRVPSINEPTLCETNSWDNGIKAFQDNNFIYIYISGGNAASTYYGKLVLDYEKYITSIFVDYYPLSTYSCFRNDFIGF